MNYIYLYFFTNCYIFLIWCFLFSQYILRFIFVMVKLKRVTLR